MDYKVVSTAAFRHDYASITSYLSNTLKSPATAKKLVANIRNVSNTLSVAPFIHAISQKRLLAERQLRECHVCGYTLLYRVNDDHIEFVRLFHQSQQYNSAHYWED